MSDKSGIYEVYAVEYAHMEREAGLNYIFADPHDSPNPMKYFVWVMKNEERTILLDIGFDHEHAKARGRTIVRHPVEGLAAMGVDAAEIETIILSHMHYDHAGTVSSFPKAEFILQEEEMHYCTGRDMGYAACRMPFDVDNVTDIVRANFAERVRFVKGDKEIAPGVSVHLVGGHSRGLQVVRVETPVGPMVLASDATHYYDNITLRNPFPIVADLGDMCAAYDRLFELGAPPERVIPGHDPLVVNHYPKHPDDDMILHLSGEVIGTPPFAKDADKVLRFGSKR